VSPVDTSSGSRLAERIARCLPGASFELETLVRLVGIEETDRTPTASVTCTGRARLLINPAFVAEHCARDEHLFLLVMHEMWHVLLGHTTLYARPTSAHNIAFDALINAGLARQHPQPQYRGFFERLNPADSFPALLLRPPVGWPSRPVYDVDGPEGTAAILKRLYPAPGRNPVEPTYEELLALLLRGGVVGDAGTSLVGNHSEDGDHADPMQDPLFGEVVRRIVAKWPPPPEVLRGRDAGGGLSDRWVDSPGSPRALRSAFAEILKRALQPHRSGFVDIGRVTEPVVVGPGPLPNLADRQLPARRRLLGRMALPNQVIVTPLQRREPPQRALVYVDVSGSMHLLLPHIVDMLIPLVRQHLVVLRQFSTEVTALSLSDLQRRTITTTGGTDIACVLDDAAQRPERRIVLLTDGYVGAPTPAQMQPLRDRKAEIITVLPIDGWAQDLEAVSTIVTLPGLEYA